VPTDAFAVHRRHSASGFPLPRINSTAIFGDLSGHLRPLVAALELLKFDTESSELPDALAVVQVGDLVHTGPDSDAVVTFVAKMMSTNADRWVQLMGNHESQYLGGTRFGHLDVSRDTEETIRGWVHHDQAHLAAAVDSAELGPVLITHAGLTRQLWTELGRPTDPAEAARLLNRMLRMDRRRAFAPGEMLQGGSHKPGVVWAAAGSELYQSWSVTGRRLPRSTATAPPGLESPGLAALDP